MHSYEVSLSYFTLIYIIFWAQLLMTQVVLGVDVVEQAWAILWNQQLKADDVSLQWRK